LKGLAVGDSLFFRSMEDLGVTRALTLALLNPLLTTLTGTVAIRSGGVAISNALASTSPLFAIPLEILVLNRRPSARTTAGAALTVVGIACLGL
jgi:drug/metabolite transporter (DMT)-like permease